MNALLRLYGTEKYHARATAKFPERTEYLQLARGDQLEPVQDKNNQEFVMRSLRSLQFPIPLQQPLIIHAPRARLLRLVSERLNARRPLTWPAEKSRRQFAAPRL